MPEAGGSMVDDALITAHPGVLRARRAIEVPVPASVSESPPPVVSMPVEVSPAPWRTALVTFAVAALALAAIYAGTIADLWHEWGATGTFAHGYFIFPISAWLVWRIRGRLASIAPKVQPLALVPMVACGMVWLAAHAVRVHSLEQYSFVAMIACLVWAVFGDEVAKRIGYPLAFLFFAVPAGDFLMPTLMDHTADFTVFALRLSGVPVFREGNYFSIPSGNWSVVEACSGLRYLIASVTLGFLFAYLNYRATWRRVAFIVAALLVPIIANWLRAYMIVMIAHLSSNKLATGVDHLIYGWLFFGLVMMLLFWVGNFWREDDEIDAPEPARNDALGRSSIASAPRAIVAMSMAVFAVAAPWPALGDVLERIANAPRPGSIALDRIEGWQPAPAFTKFVPHFLRSRASSNQAYSSDGREVGVFVAYYSGQLDNGLLVTFDNDVVLVSDKVWGSVAERARSVAIDGHQLPVVENVIVGAPGGADQRLLSWRWYWINGRLTSSKYAAKAYNAIDKLAGRGDDSAVVVLTTPIVAGQPEVEAEAALRAFATAAEPQIAARLAAIHDQARQ
jgi:exosortase A